MTRSIAFLESRARNRRELLGTVAEPRRMSRDQLCEWLKWYEAEDYERMADSLEPTVLVSRLRTYEIHFETAAYAYWWARPNFARPSCSDVAKQLRKIRDAAEKLYSLAGPLSHSSFLSDPRIVDAVDKLLLYLGIDDLLDGTSPRDLGVCQFLIEVEPSIGTSELESLAEKLGRTVEVISIAAELKYRAEEAARDVEKLHDLTQLAGHRGDSRLNAWVDHMMTIYKILLGAKGILSESDDDDGQARSLCAFIECAAKPLRVSLTKAQWYKRVRTVRNIRRQTIISIGQLG